jgi:hypothetical protein
LEQVTSTYSQDLAALDLLTKLSIASDSVPNFTLINGPLRYKNKVWLGSNKPMQQQVMHALHSSPLGGHSGVPGYIQENQATVLLGGNEGRYPLFCTVLLYLSAS